MRRKRRFGWMPTLGNTSSLANTRYSFLNFSVAVVNDAGVSPLLQPGSPTLGVFPVILDRPLEAGEVENAEGDAPGRLPDIIGQEWFCERIVGSLFIGLDLGDTGQNVPNGVIVTCGFFISRAGDAASPEGAGQPIGGPTFNSYSPAAQNAIREPWMWRRSWILGGSVTPGQGFSNFPTANAFYGSALEATKVDVKSVRRIGNDDRLFFACGTTTVASVEGDKVDGRISGCLDVRVLGALRKPRPTGKF